MPRPRLTDDDGDESLLLIPPSRMRNMMKSSPDVDCVSSESVICLIKATEMFIKEILTLSYSKSSGELTYENLSRTQSQLSRYSFLSDILPPKITFKEWTEKYKHLYEQSYSILCL
ncbi:unnamed protein product [Dibothriocephalus latus]|uniref:Transcription factor CBF/NF-Y/archaeal histone domain-containing protein n=1 Tax=Dibothriocephalus latus TaxID=60516 RepID=A0A3P7P6R0_DIBLA|nr:unnamed protein product [Dibothriocephalus latus]